jgi:hypothetical protein
MKTKLNPAVAHDRSEADRFAAMVESPAFGALRGRMEAALDRERITCERADGEMELRRAQGAVSALRTILGLPKVMLAEMKKGE